MLSLELGNEREPTICECCGRPSHSAYGFIYRDGGAFALYNAAWSAGHPEAGLSLSLEFGDWSEDATPIRRFQMALSITTSATEVLFAFIDPERSPWGNHPKKGRMLTRDEALQHPMKTDALHAAEHCVQDDFRLRQALEGSQASV